MPGPDDAPRLGKAEANGAKVFHAGTAFANDASEDSATGDGALIAKGGRVLNVTARGADVKTAQAAAYRAVDAIDWPGGFCRRDIGWRAVARETGLD
jgi:phosphoribosylamine--glycine ligase